MHNEEGLNLELILEDSDEHQEPLVEEDSQQQQASVALDNTTIMSAPITSKFRVVNAKVALRRESNRISAEHARRRKKLGHARLAKALRELSEWRRERDSAYACALVVSKQLYDVELKRNADDYCEGIAHAVLEGAAPP